MLVKNTTTHTCHTEVTIHVEPEVFLKALLGNHMKVGKMVYQNSVEKGVVYWSFMVNKSKSCDLLMRMRVEERDGEEGVFIRVDSVDEEGESADEGMKQEI